MEEEFNTADIILGILSTVAIQDEKAKEDQENHHSDENEVK